jgi:Uma2 family endonuclease
MVARREAQRMTVDEWRELERTSHDIKHEYIDGRAYAMSGGSLAHGRIGLNACLALESAIHANNKPCFSNHPRVYDGCHEVPGDRNLSSHSADLDV